MTNDGLTAYQRVGGSGSVQLVPDLAVSLPSPTDGGTTYTFQLRRGIRFSNGQLVRPEDFRRALQRDLILGPGPLYGDPFADVIGGAACAAHPRHCDLSRGVVVDDAANTVTFHLVAPDTEFLSRLSLPDAVAVPAATPMRNIGLHPLPATGPYMWGKLTNNVAVLVRNPYFRQWSHAAQPDGYPDRIVYRLLPNLSAEITAIERGRADFTIAGPPPDLVDELQTRFPSQLHLTPGIASVNYLALNTRVAPFTDVRVRRALNYAIDRAKVAGLLGYTRPSCQLLPPYFPGYRPYCPYTLDPNPAGAWRAPDLYKAERLIAASHTRGTPITIWNFTSQVFGQDLTPIEPYLVSLLDRLGYPTRVENLSGINAPLRFADSRTRAQAALTGTNPWYPSPSQIIQANFACQSFRPDSTANANLSEFCDHRLDTQIAQALAAESANSPDTASLWAQADRTLTNRAPFVALTIPTTVDFVSGRVGNYQQNFQIGVLEDQLWVR
jgi:peptide/nickel transport system substrate-binding protein